LRGNFKDKQLVMSLEKKLTRAQWLLKEL